MNVYDACPSEFLLGAKRFPANVMPFPHTCVVSPNKRSNLFVGPGENALRQVTHAHGVVEHRH